MINRLPLELIYYTMEWMEPFDILNLSYVLKIKCNRLFYTSCLKPYIKKFCNNKTFETIVNCILRDTRFVDYDILYIFGKIIDIINKSSKYMDVLGYNTYIFNLTTGKPFISIHTVPIIYMDTQIINIHFPDVEKLEGYLQKYMNFSKNSKNSYKIKKYNLKYLIK
jgi:hypothetical protein